VGLHLGLSEERCPTGSWDLQTSLAERTRAGSGGGDKARQAA